MRASDEGIAMRVVRNSLLLRPFKACLGDATEGWFSSSSSSRLRLAPSSGIPGYYPARPTVVPLTVTNTLWSYMFMCLSYQQTVNSYKYDFICLCSSACACKGHWVSPPWR